MDDVKEQTSSPSSRRRLDIWLEVLGALGGLLAISVASLTSLSELTSGFTSAVLALFITAVALQTVLVTRHYRRSTPAQDLKEQVRKAYSDALNQLPTRSVKGT